MPRARSAWRNRVRRRYWSQATIGRLLPTPWRAPLPIRESTFTFSWRRSSEGATQRSSDSERMTMRRARWRSSKRQVEGGVLPDLREVLAVKLLVRREAHGALENGNRLGVVT